MAVDVNPTVPRNLEELAGDMKLLVLKLWIILLALSHRLSFGQNSIPQLLIALAKSVTTPR